MFFTFVTKILLTLLFLNTVCVELKSKIYEYCERNFKKSPTLEIQAYSCNICYIYTCLLDEFLRNAR